MDKIPNIRHLRAFSAVCECKSISKASELVFLSQPAITQAMSKLEALFDSTLFDRKSDGMYLTDSGELLAARIDRALQLVLDGLRDVVRSGAGSNSAGNSSGGNSGKATQLFNVVTTTQLRALIAVVASRNYSLAGRSIGVSQSALHRSCRELEGLLSITLFEKTSIGISPTKAALQLSKATKLAFSEIEQAQQEIHALNHRDIGHMVIGSMPLARTSVLPSTIIAFSECYPDFKLTINEGSYDDLLYHLRHADLDLLVGALRFPSPSDDVVQHELFTSEVVIIGRADHPLGKVGEISLSQLIDASWVLPTEGTPTRKIFDQLFEVAEQPKPQRIVEASSQPIIRSLLEGSDRLTMLSKHQLQRELADGSVAVLPFTMPSASRPIGITVRKGWQPTATQQAFIDTLIQKSERMD